MALKFSISGLRGIVGRDLNPDVVFKYARAFGEFIRSGHVVIGRDTRASGREYRRAVIDGCQSAGCRVTDLGIVPTPTVLFIIRKIKAKGGIVITASHNPMQWNALKFVSSQGLFLNESEFRRFNKYINAGEPAGHATQKVELLKSGLQEHIHKIVSAVKPLQIPFRVAVDAVNGAGSIGLPRVLEEMGCKVFRLNCKFSPIFPRGPEPVSKNIGALCRFVRQCKLDIGFACDPDCDRLAIVDEQGRPIGEENTLVLATDYILGRKKGSVVTNLSTTALMDFVVRKHKARLYRTKVGEANVVSKMKSASAVIGGEGNGGVIFPDINFTRDAMVGAALIIKFLSLRGTPISEIMAGYPRYHLAKRKVPISNERFEEKKNKIVKAFRGRVDFTDGLKIIGDNYWLHIRPSQTEHVVRIIGESGDKAQIENYINRVKSILNRG
jgi:phosphomannomutase